MSSFKWNPGAVEKLKQDATRELERRLSTVRCPVHGTGVTMNHIGPDGKPAQEGLCCERLADAIRAALR